MSTGRTVLGLHVAWALPLAALAIWFGLIDSPAFGEDRCSSCGVEGYVVVAHVVAAGWLAGVVAWAAAARRRLREGVTAPGAVTLAGLAAVALFVVAALVWEELFNVPAFVGMILCIALFPAAVLLWVVGAVAWWRPPDSEDELMRRVGSELVAAWVSLTVLLPGMFGWVWADRVEWFVW